MTIKKFFVSLAVGLTFLGVSVTLALAVGNNGSFENGNLPNPVYTTLAATDTTSLDSWKVASGSIDYIGSFWQAADGSRSLDMNGLAPGSISQELETITGATYQVSFNLSGNSDRTNAGPSTNPSIKVLTVSAGGKSESFNFDVATEINTRTDMKWKIKAFSFVATGMNTTLTFASQTPGAYGPALDNVVIIETLPGNKNECKKGGWKTFGVFKNQGDCVSYVATGGKNLPAKLNPVSKDVCKNGGWQTFGIYKNQGECMSSEAKGGKKLPAKP
jgi:choice-of-anchor C domain-containing protein